MRRHRPPSTCSNRERELVAIREAIRLDSALGRALINILLVFAQMEREATGERTREAIRHIRDSGYHFGKVPYGKQAIPAPDHPRMRILVEDDEEQAGTSESQVLPRTLRDGHRSRAVDGHQRRAGVGAGG
ncbi:MAG: recombinase family protein [Myxococcales bacterium]|nr:recombinase family protein [Myxococcales bacterium]